MLFLGSCVGVGAEIGIRKDGSGVISLEYRFSREMEALGKQDGNEGWPTLPVGKADFERTAARIEGLTLVSFSSKPMDRDMVNRIKLRFSTPEALIRFLDSTGQRAVLVQEGGKSRLTLRFAGPARNLTPDLAALASMAFEGYALVFNLTLPGTGELRLLDQTGGILTAPPAGTILGMGNKVAFTVPMADLMVSPEPVIMEILW
jgi:hypothetical protein